jgi:hypothetical protein
MTDTQYLDVRHKVPELARIVRQKPEHVYNLTRGNHLKHACQDGVVTVSLREWNDYQAKVKR